METYISKGFSQEERDNVATLYWEAFAAKLNIVLGPHNKATLFIAKHLNPDFALVARNAEGQILGIAGFKTAKGELISAGLMDLAKTYGWPSTLWRAPLLSLVERDLAEGVLLMDGICVDASARGLGVGSKLLDAIIAEADQRGLNAVRLDVIQTNPRAKALYERKGFKAIGVEDLGPLRWIFGFSSSTKMLYSLSSQAVDGFL